MCVELGSFGFDVVVIDGAAQVNRLASAMLESQLFTPTLLVKDNFTLLSQKGSPCSAGGAKSFSKHVQLPSCCLGLA